MDINEYKTKALRTDYADYSDFHTGDVSARLDYASMGLVTESAKVLDIIKKSKKSLAPLNREKLKEELGDLLWYMNLTLDELGISFEELMEASIAKIDRKHPEGDPVIRGEDTIILEENSVLKNKFYEFNNNLEILLNSINNISEYDAKKIIKRYTAAIEGNFLSWMAGALISVKSDFAKFTIDDNLKTEVQEDHNTMLNNFSISCKAHPNSEDYNYVYNEVSEIRSMVSELSGLKNIALMAILENASLVFIPWLEKLAISLECKNLEYTNLHGEADINHANLFLKSLDCEKELNYDNVYENIDYVMDLVFELFKKCFIIKDERLVGK